MGDKKIIIPDTPKKEIKEEGVITQKISLNCTAKMTADAYGVSLPRKAEILKKMIAVAQIYPRYSTISEVFLNCADRFTEKERIYGIFLLGKINGMATMMKIANLQTKCNTLTMNREQKLLSLLSKRVIVEDPLLQNLLKKGS